MMYYFQIQVQRMLGNMKESVPMSSVNIINDSLESLDALMSAILQPLIGKNKLKFLFLVNQIKHNADGYGNLYYFLQCVPR